MALSSGASEEDQARGQGDFGREITSVRFAAVARRLSEAARLAGVEPPGFRSPPRSPGVRRSIRREADGSATVSVAMRGRPGLSVIADMVDGVVLASGLSGLEAALVRDQLWSALAKLLDEGSDLGGEPLLTHRAA